MCENIWNDRKKCAVCGTGSECLRTKKDYKKEMKQVCRVCFNAMGGCQ